MRSITNRKSRQPAKSRLAAASNYGLEALEVRQLLSTTLAAWQFDMVQSSNPEVSSTSLTSPATTSGTGMAYSVGMQPTNAGGYTYPANGANAGTDASSFLAATGEADSGGNGGSEGGNNGYVWRVQSGQNQAAPIGSQGAQFNVSTAGQTGIGFQFDMDPSSGKAEAQFMVEYTTNLTAATPTWVDVTQYLTFGSGDAADPNNGGHVASIGFNSNDDIYIQQNSTNTNLVPTGTSATLNSGAAPYTINGNGGYYATIQGPLVGGTNTAWLNDLMVNLSGTNGAGVTGVNNDANFAFRVVNAATGTSETSVVAGTTAFKNWRFNDIEVNSGETTAPVPSVSSVSVTPTPITQGGGPVSLSAVVTETNGTPSSVSFYREAVNGTENPAVDALVPGTATNSGPTWTLAPATVSGLAVGTYKYYAVATDSTNMTTSGTSPTATLSVISDNPVSQTVPAGGSASFTAGDSNSYTSVQWYSQAPGAGSFTLLSNGGNVSGATTTTLTINPVTEGLTGTQYEAQFSGPVFTPAPATLTVIGTPITAWDFNNTQVIGAPASGSLTQGLGNSPYASVNNAGPVTSPVAVPLGLQNSYTGLQSYPEADNVPVASTINPAFVPVVWRLRGGGGGGAGGSPGVPEGWSQEAPQYDNAYGQSQTDQNGNAIGVQGAQWTLNTTGYDNVTLHFDWNQGGIADLQPQYYNGSAWVNVPYAAGDTGLDIIPGGGTTGGQSPVDPTGGDLIEATGSDYYGLTSPTGSPTGVTVNLQGIAAAANNPDFQFRLVTAYSPSLPEVTDGNAYLSSSYLTFSHGQYATGGPGAVNAQQVIQFGNDQYGSTTHSFTNQDDVTGGDFTLTFTPASGPSQTTADIAYSSNPTTLASNIQAALGALTDIGAANVSVAATNPSGVNPLTLALGDSNTDMTVTFKGTLAGTSVNTLTAASASDIPLTGDNVSITVQNWVNGSASGFKPYVDGGGSEDLANISFNGDTVTGTPTPTQITGLSVVSPPAVTPASTPTNTATATYPVTLTSQVYSELGTPTAQWQYLPSGGSTWLNFPGSANVSNVSTSLTPGANNTSTASLTFTPGDTSLNGAQFQVVYSAGSGPTMTTTQPTTLNVIVASAPIITLQPVNTTAQEGNAVLLLATATGAPTPTVQWYYELPGATSFTALTDSAGSNPKILGSTYEQLRYVTDANGDENGTNFYATFSSGALTTNTNTITLTVLPTETAVADWNFASHSLATTTVSLTNLSTMQGSETVSVASVTGLAVGMEVQTGTVNTPLTDNNQTGPLPTPTGIPIGSTITSINTNDNTFTISQPSDMTETNVVGTAGAGSYDNSPAPSAGTGTAIPLGFNQAYNAGQPGTGSTGSVTAADVTAQVGTINPNFTENVWRVRGGPTEFSGGSPANGWNAFAAQDTQGAEFNVPTTGYDSVYVTVDWYSTHSGFRDLQEQYNTNVNSSSGWTNINPIYYGYADDYYGLDATGGVVPLTIDLTGISGAQNDPNFGVRFVAPYDPTLSNVQTLSLNDTSNFTLTFGSQVANVTYSPSGTQLATNIQNALGALSSINNSADPNNVSVAYNGGNVYTVTFGGTLDNVLQPTLVSSGTNDFVSQTQEYASAQVGVGTTPTPGESTGAPNVYAGAKGNWRFDNIEVHGAALPGWLSVSPGASVNWNQSAETLSVTSGTATIIADPNETQFNGGAGDEPTITVSGVGSKLEIDPTNSVAGDTGGDGSLLVHIGGLTVSGGAVADVASVASRSHSNHEVLVVGVKAVSASNPTFTSDSASKIDMHDNDLIIHTGESLALGQSELAAVQSLAYGANGGRHNGRWTGNELTSSTAAARRAADLRETTQLAVVLNNDLSPRLSSWAVGATSESLNRYDIIVKYTYTGDFNLDGQVAAADSSILGLKYNSGATSGNEWAFGDTNDDGLLNTTDISAFGVDFGDGTASAGDTADQVQL